MAFRARSASAARRVTSRDTTGSEATGPNSSGCARSIATSARQSPPSARATARSVMIFPGLCTARAGPPSFQRCVQAAVQARDPQRLGQQQAAGLREDSGAVSGQHDLGTAGLRVPGDAWRLDANRTRLSTVATGHPWASKRRWQGLEPTRAVPLWPARPDQACTLPHSLLRHWDGRD